MKNDEINLAQGSRVESQTYIFMYFRKSLGSYYTEWSKSEREKQILYIKAYMWNLEKRYWWTYLQGRNRDADRETGQVDMGVGEGDGGMNWRLGLTYIHYHV